MNLPAKIRRLVLLPLLLALCGSSALAQPAGKMPRLCYLTFDPWTPGGGRFSPFFDRLRELGYVDGRTIAIDGLSANGKADAYPRLAAECVQRNADVIVVTTTPAAQAARRATGKIPIVMVATGDPVGTGLVASLARPGGNITGTTSMGPQMAVKRLELLKEVVPRLSRALVLTYPSDPISSGQIAALQEAAKSLRVDLLIHNVDGPEDIAAGLAIGRKALVDGVMTTLESIFSVQSPQIIELCRIHSLPAVFLASTFVTAGGLMSYAPDRDALISRSADIVDKVLNGARPGDLPVELPTLFKLAVNLKTAKALGLTIPPSILARADEVIE